ncbi:uncharacterized protein LOC118511435 isoform X2 [Anopheles stephensi]|uniref:uncharacterized protein LOC118511435 isoform X2 n=1 Tax=Anopheles stephensi TaxID=30069 RepID=UPI0016587308|nr:uncharacterized protein LOC118511435 isoform X2 [Anopheles stephensi]
MNSNTITMNGDQKNESFKLLQLSDDSKSLSDLELAEVVSQRKRKVRRKTRQRTSSYRGDDERSLSGRSGQMDCKNFGIWLAVAMTVLWLFIISYVTSVIHGENHRLELALQKVSATSQNVPEALQKWHETSKNLEQNQTALNGKLREMQQVLTNFFGELKQLRETIDKKNENSQEAQLNRLQSSVADLGSNIGDSNSRIGLLETRFDTIQADQKQLNKTLDDLQKLFSRIQNSTVVTDIIGGDGMAKGMEKTIAELRDQLTGQLNNLAQNVTGELQVLKQKNVWLESDLSNQTKRIEQLFDNTVNISSHVLSIEAVWLEARNNASALEADRKLINEQLAALANVTTGLHGTIEKVQEECQQYHSKLDEVRGKLGELQDQIQQNAARKEAAMHRPDEANRTDQVNKGNMPPLLSQFFDEQQTASTAASVRISAPPKPTAASSSSSSSGGSTTTTTTTTTAASLAKLYPGTLVQQLTTTPQPPSPSGVTKPGDGAAANTGSKKSDGLFDSVM